MRPRKYRKQAKNPTTKNNFGTTRSDGMKHTNRNEESNERYKKKLIQ